MIGTCIVVLVICEFGIRWLFPVYDPVGRMEFRCQNGAYRGISNTRSRQWVNTGEYDVDVQINQYGFRDSKDMLQSSPSDIFVVGDSFSFGHGVEENQRFSNLLDEKLRASVFNLAMPNNLDGYINLLNYANANGAKIENVIVGICMENDLERYPEEITKCKKRRLFEWKDLVLSPQSINFLQLKLELTRQSALYSLITSVIQQNIAIRELATEFGVIHDRSKFIGMDQFDEFALQSSVKRLVEISNQYNAVMLVIPSRGLWQGNIVSEQTKIHDRFVSILKSLNLNYVDMRPEFESDGDPISNHFRLEGHWNATGHKKAAQKLNEKIRELGVVN